MNRDELIKQLQAMDKNSEVLIDLETTYDGSPIDINNCSSCLPGSYSKAGFPNCNLCSKGTYQDSEGSGECIDCPNGAVCDKGSVFPSSAYGHQVDPEDPGFAVSRCG